MLWGDLAVVVVSEEERDARDMSGLFGRVFGYVFNELLVNGLANSRTFQQFAVRTDKALREVQKSGE